MTKLAVAAIASDQSKGASTIASGTAAAEIGTGSAAARLAKGWDGLKLWLDKLAGKPWGTVTFVEAEVGLPVKGGNVMLTLAAILVEEDAKWRWVPGLRGPTRATGEPVSFVTASSLRVQNGTVAGSK
jgi:hypothetical protein